MANSILKNDVAILRCANWAMEDFFNNFLTVVEQADLKENPVIVEFLEQLDQEMQGRGFVMVDIKNYFDDSPGKLPLKLFYELACKAISRIKQKDYGEFQEGYFNRLDEFLAKILG